MKKWRQKYKGTTASDVAEFKIKKTSENEMNAMTENGKRHLQGQSSRFQDFLRIFLH